MTRRRFLGHKKNEKRPSRAPGDSTFPDSVWAKAVDEGDPEARFYVGSAYFHAQHNMDCDYEKAMMWLEKCIGGLTTTTDFEGDAQYMLGLCYRQDVGPTGRNWIASAYWLAKAAVEHSHALAMYELGKMYEVGGHGFQVDIAMALHWLEQAKSHGVAEREHGSIHVTADIQRVLTKLQQQKFLYHMEARIRPNKETNKTDDELRAEVQRLRARVQTLEEQNKQLLQGSSSLW